MTKTIRPAHASLSEQARTACVTTASGRRVYPLAGTGDFHIDDIAHHLSMICRFNGATSRHYSVAEHSIRVATLLGNRGFSPEIQLAGLLHDAAEAYLGDIAGPIKGSAFFRLTDVAPSVFLFEEVERRLLVAILRVLELECLTPHLDGVPLERADMTMRATEMRDLCAAEMRDERLPPPLKTEISRLRWAPSPRAFLGHFRTLVAEVKEHL